MTTRLVALASIALLGAVPAAFAATASAPVTNYTLDPARSALKFLFKQAGAENQGRFRKFSVLLRFSDSKLAASRLEVTIDVNSLDTGDDERDTTLRGADLFNVAKYPQAHFKSKQITRVAAGRYEAIGKLTIRDVSHDIRVPFAFRTADEKGVAAGYMTGRAVINRLDYGVGQGDWKATDQVANEVDVSFGLRFTPAAPAAAAPAK